MRISATPLTVIALLLAVGIAGAEAAEPPSPAAQPAPAPAAASAADPIADLTLEQRLGQLFLINVVGKEAPVEASAAVLRSVPVGAIILFSYNLKGGPERVAKLNRALQEIALTTGPRIPYLISVDQEGGRVQRLRRGFTKLPAPRLLGDLPPARLEKLAGAVARQLLAVGVNMNLAPVVEAAAGEADVIGDRSFGGSPEHAAAAAAAFIKGSQAAGVVATAKHFPGNAASDVDPHKAMPRIPLTVEEIRAQLLPPFRAAIAAGVDAVMLSHAEIPALDQTRPVALSPAVVGGLLREELGFSGLVCSDDLLMGAVTEKFAPAEAAILAVAAGTDLLMVSNPAEVPALHAALVAAVTSGRLDADTVAAAARRVVQAKKRRQLWDSAGRVRRGESLADLARARRAGNRLLPPKDLTAPAEGAK